MSISPKSEAFVPDFSDDKIGISFLTFCIFRGKLLSTDLLCFLLRIIINYLSAFFFECIFRSDRTSRTGVSVGVSVVFIENLH